MCRHILNAQCSIRAQCCKRWFDCSQCHAEVSDHALVKTHEMIFACKSCRRVSRKDTRDYDQATDSHCPHCDILWDREAVTPESVGLRQVQANGTKDGSSIAVPDTRVASGLIYDPRMKYTGPDFLKDDEARTELEREMRLLRDEAEVAGRSEAVKREERLKERTLWTREGKGDDRGLSQAQPTASLPTEEELAELLSA